MIGPLVDGVHQVCVVVRDMESALAEYARRLGIGPWRVFRFAPPRLTETRIRGRDVPYSMWVALANTGPMQWELIQPIDGSSIYEEFLAAHGEGLHHVQVSYGDRTFEEAIQAYSDRGMPPVMEGNFAGSRFAYFDSEEPLRTIIEIRYAPPDFVRPEPDYWYPEKSGG